MSHSGRSNRYRNLGELNSNQQHIYDIYHTPARHFSAISLREGRKTRKNIKSSDNNKLRKNWVQLFLSLFPTFRRAFCQRVSCTLNKKGKFRGFEHALRLLDCEIRDVWGFGNLFRIVMPWELNFDFHYLSCFDCKIQIQIQTSSEPCVCASHLTNPNMHEICQ